MNAEHGQTSGVTERSGAQNSSETGGKKTIVLVHGTFASPRDRDTRVPGGQPAIAEWYRPGGSFCLQLDAYLAELGSNARTWKHLGEGHEQFFRWSGDNSWQARSAAADRLATYLRRLAARGWTCHVIAHSHGGNVVIDAIRKLRWMEDPFLGEGFGNPALANVCLLGTPIYTRSRSRGQMVLYAASVIAPITAVLLHDLTSAQSLVGTIAWAPILYWFCGLGALILFLRFVAWFLRTFMGVMAGAFSQEFGFYPLSVSDTYFVAVNSASDEAYQLLQGVLNAKDPLGHISLRIPQIVRDAATLARQVDHHVFGADDIVSRATGMITLAVLGAVTVLKWSGYLVPGFWLAILVASYAVLGAVSLASALRGLALPVRLLIGLYELFTGIARAVVSVLLSNRIWEAVRASVLGTSGAPFATQDLAISRGDQEEPVLALPLVYEELAPDVVARVIAGRDRSVAEAIQRVLRSVDAPEALADAVEALKETATNLTLVHAAYYTEPAVIKLVAQRILAPPAGRTTSS